MFEFQKYKSNDVPDSPGIYAFHLNPFSLQKLGLIGVSRFTKQEIDSAKRRLYRKILQASELIHFRELRGDISEGHKSVANRLELRLVGSTKSSFSQNWLEEKIEPIEDVLSLIRVLEVVSMVIPPLYVGIALDQTLSHRYDQHFRDYLQRSPKCFGGRLAAQGLDWEETTFTAIKLPIDVANSELVNLVEDIIHGLTKPIFSYA